MPDAEVFLSACRETDLSRYISNGAGRLSALAVGSTVLFVPSRVRDASYVCSPSSHYVGYPRDELAKLRDPFRRYGMRFGLSAAAGLCRATKFDDVVYVNNWLLSTNPSPPSVSVDEISTTTRQLTHEFPDRAIVFRSVNRRLDPEYAAGLDRCGYLLVPSRQVYLLDCASASIRHNENVRRDLNLLDRLTVSRQ